MGARQSHRRAFRRRYSPLDLSRSRRADLSPGVSPSALRRRRAASRRKSGSNCSRARRARPPTGARLSPWPRSASAATNRRRPSCRRARRARPPTGAGLSLWPRSASAAGTRTGVTGEKLLPERAELDEGGAAQGPRRLRTARISRDWPVPQPRAGEALIHIARRRVNNTDINTRIAWYSKAVREGTTASRRRRDIRGAERRGFRVDRLGPSFPAHTARGRLRRIVASVAASPPSASANAC